MSAAFPRQARVRARAEFDRVFAHGRRTASPLMALHWHDDGAPPRLGLAVSRKVDPHAVGRNRIKRALREEFRALRAALPLLPSESEGELKGLLQLFGDGVMLGGWSGQGLTVRSRSALPGGLLASPGSRTRR